MKIITHLHFYQPHNQQEDILHRIVNESYRPLISGLLDISRTKLVVNISGVLTRLLMERGYEDVVQGMIKMYEQGKLEFTGSAMYHALLPLLPKEEVVRQISQNDIINKEYFGKDVYNPVGFFSPEMAVNNDLIKIISEEGYKWIGVPKLSHPGGEPEYFTLYRDKETGMKLFFRNKRVSALILSAVEHTAEGVVRETQDLHDKDKYWYLAMDAETFGHHRVGHEKLLFDIVQNDFFEPVFAGEMTENKQNLPVQDVTIRPSTWTNEEQDFWLDDERTQRTSSKSFILWNDPSNPIHKVQRELTNYVIRLVNDYDRKDGKEWKEARKKLDPAISSDQYWWASAKPWWSLEMIEQGAYDLKNVIETLYDKDSKEVRKVNEYYRKILDIAFKWQREGTIRKKHVEASGTYLKKPFKERTPAGWFNVIIVDLEAEMLSAAEEKNYEKAIKWRDAIYKIEQGSDIYDILHVVDEFWSGRKIMFNKPLNEKSWDELSDFIKGYLKDIKTEEDFENWKKQSKLN
jgi:hypothetical protein